MNKFNSLIIIFLFLFLFLIPLSHAGLIDNILNFFGFGDKSFTGDGLGDLSIKTEGKSWNVLKSDGIQKELFNVIVEGNKICFFPKQVMSGNDKNLNHIKAYTWKNGVEGRTIEPSDFEKETEKGNLKKICYNANPTTEDKLRFGENSTIIVYQDIKTINYDIGWVNFNAVLYKNISDTWNNTVNDIFVYNQKDKLKWGANDSSNENIELYKYRIESTKEIIQHGWTPYIQNPNSTSNEVNATYENHVLNFEDICSKKFEPYPCEEFGENITCYNKTAECKFNYISNKTLEVTFYSDKEIDPKIIPVKTVINFKEYETRELARKEFIDRDLNRIVFKSEMVEVEVQGLGTVLTPKISRILNAKGIAWGISAWEDDGDAYVHIESNVIPNEVKNVKGIQQINLTRGDYDRLIPKWANDSTGHFSYAHTNQIYLDDFSTDYDPLETDADWDKELGNSIAYASVGVCNYNWEVSSGCWYSNAAVGTMSTADYSVETILGGSSTSYFNDILGRLIFSTDYLRARFRPQAGNDVYLYRRVNNGTVTEIGAADTDDTGTGLIRLEMVSTTFKVYWKGNETNPIIDVADAGAPTGAGKVGFYGSSTEYGYILDNFAVYIAEAGDTTPPYFTTIPENVSINYTQGFRVDFVADDETAFDSYTVNDTTWFEINSTGSLYNTTLTVAGVRLINITINDSSNNLNSTLYMVNVSRKTSTNCGLFVNPAMEVKYPTANKYQTINPGDPGDDDITLRLFRNGTEVSNPDNTVLKVGVYDYISNMTGGQNWTDKAECGGSSFTVTPGDIITATFINHTESNFTAYNSSAQNIWLNGTADNTEGNIVLYVNGTLYNNGTSPIQNMTNLTEGIYNVSVVYYATQNYTNNLSYWWVNVTNYTAPDNLYPNITINYPTNTTYNTNSIDFNVTALDNYRIDTCLVSIDAGVTNYTMHNLTLTDYNFTNATIPDGSYQAIFYCNDSSNNLNNTETEDFSIDADPPYFITVPANATIYFNETLGVDFEGDDAVGFDSYVVNDSRFSINETGWLENSTSIVVGTLLLNITINDTSNHLNSTLWQITINQVIGLVHAFINHTEADFTTINDSSINIWLNGTLEFGEGNINLTLNGTSVNYGASPLSNLTNLTEGFYSFNVSYDGSQNYSKAKDGWMINITNYTVADTTPPTFDNLINHTQHANLSFNYDLDASDNYAVDSFILNDTGNFTIDISTGNIADTGFLNLTMIYWLNVTINDTSNNIHSGIFYINITEELAIAPVGRVFLKPHTFRMPYILLNSSLDFTSQ